MQLPPLLFSPDKRSEMRSLINVAEIAMTKYLRAYMVSKVLVVEQADVSFRTGRSKCPGARAFRAKQMLQK